MRSLGASDPEDLPLLGVGQLGEGLDKAQEGCGESGEEEGMEEGQREERKG